LLDDIATCWPRSMTAPSAPTTEAPACSSCWPRWTTPPTGRPNDLARFRQIARLLGQPLAPWQEHVAGIATERNPVTGRPAYNRVIVIVPRRAGKSFLMLVALLTNGVTPASRAFYCSHRRETSAAMWRDDWFPIIEQSPLARYLRIRRANGSEAITWRTGQSSCRLLPADGNAARSFRSNLAMIDEARELTDEQGADLEAGLFPTQATGRGGQTWIVSNAGTAASTWLRGWRDVGIAAVTEGRTDRTAFFEWSADPSADRDDPATWLAAHPGLGHHVLLDALEADHEAMTPTDFATEYLGIWADALVDTDLLDAWAAGIRPKAAPAAPLAFAVETSEDRTRSVIVAAGAPLGGRLTDTVVELIEDRPHEGGAWLGPRLAELAERHNPTAIAYDNRGPAAASALDMADVPAKIAGLRTDHVIAAAGMFHDRTVAGALTHRDDPTMTAAVAALRRRTAGGAWVYDRREPAALPAIAATLAAYAHRTNLAPTVH
jgi:hypothetical protein